MNIYSINKIWKPEIYQGHRRKKKYFEGWYFKLVDKSEENVYSIIAGVATDKYREKHSFIQIIDGKKTKSFNFKYSYNDFSYSKDNFKIKIGNNRFSNEKIMLDIDDKKLQIQGEIKLNNLKPWPVTIFSPGVMGWYSFVPFMECYHGVLSMDNNISGVIKVNNEYINFDEGIGYIEKDWGVSFPEAWIWAQSNHFDKEKVSIFLSIAKIPWLRRSFDGFLVGLLIDNKLYRFTTYTKAKINKLEYKENIINIQIVDRKYILDINIEKGNTAELLSPIEGSMKGKVYESVSGRIRVKLSEKYNNIIFEGIGRNSGVEITGILK